ncbi:uncharacterized protein LOC115724643 [Cannabis sativa]|uniref:uncharacterized protein LOC115724643 n=1 Tax=Cannabis sativa TaxID=3483 RepID=UPI0011E050A2|nr:uncharacterized protein LOC115724643 [Cannabis sativa]
MSNSNEFHKTHSSIFRCLDCDFKLHLLCGPLPSTIKHESHIHCLNLIDSCIEDTFGDYYCDICEEERNPRVRVYYCAECKYVAHVHCVLSEIIKVLKGDLRDVKLKTLGSDLFYNSADDQHTIQATSSLFTFREFIRKLPVNDLRILKGQFYWDDNDDDEEDMMSKREDAHDEIIVIEELIKYSTLAKHDFVEFIFKEFRSSYGKKKLKLKGSDLALKIVDVEGYSMPLNLISAMKDLFHKHGDMSTQSSYSKEFKSICFYLICKVVKELHTTLVTDITKHLLQQWYHYIHFVKDFTYFEVDFVWECLKKITGDFYYQQMNKLLCTDVPTILKKRIDELQKNISEYQRLCESSSTEQSMKEGLEEAMYSKWKLASQIGF